MTQQSPRARTHPKGVFGSTRTSANPGAFHLVEQMDDFTVKTYSWQEFKASGKPQRKEKRRPSAPSIGDAIKLMGGIERFAEAALASPEVVAVVSRELLARGLINTAFARGIKTHRAGDFYSSKAWATVRYAALMKHGARCQCCGATAADGARMHVDHIKPRSKYPDLALELSNLQVLCDLCNTAKSNIDQTDWSAVAPNESGDYFEYMEEERRIVRLLKTIA